jgi:hypothetical protein
MGALVLQVLEMSTDDRNTVLNRLVMNRVSTDAAMVCKALHAAVTLHPASPGAQQLSSAFVDMIAQGKMANKTLKSEVNSVNAIVDHNMKFVVPTFF